MSKSHHKFALVGGSVLLSIMLLIAVSCGSVPTATPQPTAGPVIVVATPTSGPTPTPAPTPTPGPSPTPAPPVYIKIGVGAMLSGGGSGWGIPYAHGFELGAERVNAAGGIVTPSGKRYLLQPVIYDAPYTIDGGRTVAERLVFTDKVDYLAGVGTAVAAGMIQVAEPNNKLYFYNGAGEDLLKYRSVFRNLLAFDDYIWTMVPYSIKKWPDVKKFYMTIWDDATGQLTWSSMVKGMDQLKGIHGFEWKGELYPPKTTDFYPFITSKILPYNPDAIVGCFPAGAGEGGTLLKQLREAGFKGPFLYIGGAAMDKEIQVAGGADERLLWNGEWDYHGKYVPAEMTEVADTYTARWGGIPSQNFWGAWESVLALAAAIEKYDTVDSKVLIDKMGDVTWDSVFGGKGSWRTLAGRKSAMIHPQPVASFVGGKAEDVDPGIISPERDRLESK